MELKSKFSLTSEGMLAKETARPAVSSLTALARKFIVAESALRRELTEPLLLWEAPPKTPTDEVMFGTMSGAGSSVPREGDPRVFTVRKAGNKHNAFAMGVTLGRTENNDVILADNSVSRFHAYMLQDLKTGHWKLVDADSKNGTWIGSFRLPPSCPALLSDEARLRVGDVDLVFFLPGSFLKFLRNRLEP